MGRRRAPRITFKPIIPTLRDPMPIMADEMDTVFDLTNADIEKQYKKVSGKFRNHTVSYIKRKSFGGVAPISGGGPGWWAATSTDHFIMIILDKGGVKRRRKMSPGWRSLTRPGKGLKTYGTSGKPAGWFAKGQEPEFEAREFSKDAAQAVQKNFERRTFTAIKRAVRIAWLSKKND